MTENVRHLPSRNLISIASRSDDSDKLKITIIEHSTHLTNEVWVGREKFWIRKMEYFLHFEYMRKTNSIVRRQ